MLRISELRHKELVNDNDGKWLGYIADIEIDAAKGQIDSLILSAIGKRFAFLGHNEELPVAWNQIRKIGVDVIFIDPERRAAPDRRADRQTETAAVIQPPPSSDTTNSPFANDLFATEDTLFDL